MLKQRIITAIILIPIVLLALFYLPANLFCILSALILLGGAWEWSNLMGLKRCSARLAYLVLMAFLFFDALTFVDVNIILISAFIWWLLASLFVVLYPRARQFWNRGIIMRGIMGIFVLLPCWVALNVIRAEDGYWPLLFLFLLIWGADSAAYFTGKKWGKTKLAPQVSPGKSVQGLAGALIFTLLLSIAAAALMNLPSSRWPWVVGLGLVTVIFSVMGDLFESMLKREVGLKDSGALLPGHGGLLDRIDSLTAAAPVFAFSSWCLSMYL